MLEEIYEQPGIMRKLLDKYVDFDFDQVTMSELKYEKRRLQKINKFVFLGCGSSANASLLANYYFEELTGKNSEYEFADEFISRRAVLEPGTAVVLISQSGKTRDVLVAAEIAKEKGALVIGISNAPGSALDRISDIAINIEAGQELGVAATKSFSAQILILLLMALNFSQIFKKKFAGKEKLFSDLKILPLQIEKILKSEKAIIAIAKKMDKSKNIIVAGRKYNFPIALEGAHKIKETAYIHAEGVASEEFRHGGEAMLDKNFSFVVLVPSDDLYKDNLVLLKELKKTKVKIYIFSDKKTKQLLDFGVTERLLKNSDLLMPLMSLIPLQLLAYHLALNKGLDINNPRNIQKFV